MSQNEAILNHLRAGGSLTALDALRLYGCLRLAARIKELESYGVRIAHATIKANGKRFSQYTLYG